MTRSKQLLQIFRPKLFALMFLFHHKCACLSPCGRLMLFKSHWLGHASEPAAHGQFSGAKSEREGRVNRTPAVTNYVKDWKKRSE